MSTTDILQSDCVLPKLSADNENLVIDESSGKCTFRGDPFTGFVVEKIKGDKTGGNDQQQQRKRQYYTFVKYKNGEIIDNTEWEQQYLQQYGIPSLVIVDDYPYTNNTSDGFCKKFVDGIPFTGIAIELDKFDYSDYAKHNLENVYKDGKLIWEIQWWSEDDHELECVIKNSTSYFQMIDIHPFKLWIKDESNKNEYRSIEAIFDEDDMTMQNLCIKGDVLGKIPVSRTDLILNEKYNFPLKLDDLRTVKLCKHKFLLIVNRVNMDEVLSHLSQNEDFKKIRTLSVMVQHNCKRIVEGLRQTFIEQNLPLKYLRLYGNTANRSELMAFAKDYNGDCVVEAGTTYFGRSGGVVYKDCQ